MIIASARLSVAFDWGLEASSSFAFCIMACLAATTGDRWLQLCGLGFGLAYSQPKLCLLFRSLFGYRFMSLLVPGNNFNWGRRFDRFSKLNWRTTSLPLPLPLPLAIPFPSLAHLTPSLDVCDRTLSDLSCIVWNLYIHIHIHTCIHVWVCLFVSVWVWMNQARSFELRFIIFCSARCFFLLIYTIIFYTHPLSSYEPNRSDHIPSLP